MALDNDTRGWIMTAMSGIACVLGASVICVDIIVRLFPGKRNFRLQDSNAFLSASLSLSFGVMLFSSLYSMLPSAKNSLQKGGHSPKAAAWILIACFLGGVIGIQVVSRVIHQFMPSHIVDCDHTHGDEESTKHDHDFDKTSRSHDDDEHESSLPGYHGQQRPGLPNSATVSVDASANSDMFNSTDSFQPHQNFSSARRPSFPAQLAHKASQIVMRAKSHCDEIGPCHGFTDPCGSECFKIVQARGGTRAPVHTWPRQPGISRSATTPHASSTLHPERQPLLLQTPEYDEVNYSTPSSTAAHGRTNGFSKPRSTHSARSIHDHHSHDDHDDHHDHDHDHHDHDHDPLEQSHHHHHVPTNAFMSIGLQTSLAIALHKLPEGFITYATNHANPQLGFAVFLALFIHNITEGFAMALPLYLAINSRWKAMVISSILGGASQPLGAGVAALWFRIAGRTGIGEPGESVYGGMFAVTAGVMTSVALQLFQESMALTHSRSLCMIFAFVGMGILGVSSALTA
ncbi:Zinc-regulated transporter 3 [Lasiodiplodia hormozganensis]|uniref:Zinc-regulated transporter 3 n=1 Tax=Lasiodiplodia hormozganensis TaxID=869390 RepID=A0AA39YX03_9PEZI|nr:Zinc-regulated transporter 3 [Lasiodiplodia hormozganensis]